MAYAPGDPNQERVVLVDIEVGHRVDTPHTWTKDGTNAWYIVHTHTDEFGEHEGKPSRVVVDGVEQTEKLSYADCEFWKSTWYWHAATNRLYLHVWGDNNPGGSTYIVVAYLWRRFATRPYVFGGKPYLPLVGQGAIPEASYVTGSYHEGGTKQTFGAVKLLNGEGYFDTDLSDYIYEGKRLVARVGLNGAADVDFSIFWDGGTGDISWTENDVEISVEDLMTRVL